MNSKNKEGLHEIEKSPSNIIKSLFNNCVFVSVFLFLVSFAVFVPSLSSDFVWDDISFIKKRINQLQRQELSIKDLISQDRNRSEARKKRKERRRLNLDSPSKSKKERKNRTRKNKIDGKERKSKNTQKYFRPVFMYSIIIDAKLWGSSPLGFHLTNIILYSISTILMYFLFLLVLKEFKVSARYPVAFLSSMLFALYPLHVESVSFIAARGDILAAVFFFLTFIFYLLSYRRFLYIVPAAISFYLSFLSKEVALSFPIVIVGFDLISRRIKSRLNLFKYLILGLAFVTYLFLRSQKRMSFMDILSNREYLSSGAGSQIGEVVTIFLNSYLFYLKKLVFPFDLNPFIGTIPGGDLLYTMISIIVIAALIVVAIVSVRKKENVTGFSLLWIFATLGPAVMIAIFPLAITRFAERFLYIPSAGFCLLAGYVIIHTGIRFGRVKLSYLFGAALCLSFIFMTVKGQVIWKNELSLWEYAVSKSPREIVPKMNYANALITANMSDEAIVQYTDALSPKTYGNNKTKALAAESLGQLYLNEGDFDSAERSFKAALSLKPEYKGKFNLNMALFSLKKNDPDSAEEYLIRVTELNPEHSYAYYLLGSIYLIKGEMEQNPQFFEVARVHLEKSVDLKDAIAESHLKLAVIYARLGNIQKAKTQARLAINKGIQGSALQEARSILEMRQPTP